METDLIRRAGQKGKEIQKAEERRKWGEGECQVGRRVPVYKRHRSSNERPGQQAACTRCAEGRRGRRRVKDSNCWQIRCMDARCLSVQIVILPWACTLWRFGEFNQVEKEHRFRAMELSRYLPNHGRRSVVYYRHASNLSLFLTHTHTHTLVRFLAFQPGEI